MQEFAFSSVVASNLTGRRFFAVDAPSGGARASSARRPVRVFYLQRDGIYKGWSCCGGSLKQ
ncbi:hypothetical protein DDQ50_10530 [Amnibacterium flavum]|uniref:Uncharacterized protein n=1 Tax=Amnibacterium flavum TaxID=2173173 RepID=A0A2V1HPB3_9MICO|nr:hypothetical protein DDQ50_10530 [Amnibacterium flavum]